MRYYSKVINGETVVKPADEIKIQFNGFVFISPPEGDILADGWTFCYKDDDEIKKEIAKKKDKLIQEVINYDLSDKVRVFYKDGIPMWFDKNTRMILRTRFELESKRGKKKTVLWYDDISYPMTIEEALKLIDEVDEYAFKCYDVTQMLIGEVKSFDNLEDLDCLDYKSKYPKIMYL